jgi:heptosyltransferase-2
MKVLVIQTRYGIGDMLIFLPYLKAISEKTGVKLSLLAKDSSKAEELFRDEKFLDEVMKLDSTNDGILGFSKLRKEIKSKNFEKVFIFNGSIRYRLLALFSGIKEIYQYPFFTSKDVIFETAKVFTENYTNKILSTKPELNLNSKTLDEAKKKFNLTNHVKNIVLGISASGPTKRWDIENYINLAIKLSKNQNCKFLIAASKNDKGIIDKIKKSEIGKHCFSLENLSIQEILPIIKNCNLYIGNDTGFMHISAALGVKSIGIFVDSPAYSYSGYSDNIMAIVPVGETLDSTTHDTLGKDKISFEEVFEKTKKCLIN